NCRQKRRSAIRLILCSLKFISKRTRLPQQLSSTNFCSRVFLRSRRKDESSSFRMESCCGCRARAFSRRRERVYWKHILLPTPRRELYSHYCDKTRQMTPALWLS